MEKARASKSFRLSLEKEIDMKQENLKELLQVVFVGLVQLITDLATLVENKPVGTIVTFVFIATVVFAFASAFRNVTSKKSSS